MASTLPNKNDPRNKPRRGRKPHCKSGCDPLDDCLEILNRINGILEGTDGKKALPRRFHEQLTGRQGPPNEILFGKYKNCAEMFPGDKNAANVAMGKYIADNNITPNSFNSYAGELVKGRGATTLGWCTHEQEYNERKQELEDALDEYDDQNCPDDKLPAKARQWAGQEAPSAEQWKDAKVGKGRDFFSNFIPGGAPVKAGKMLWKGAKWLFGGPAKPAYALP